ncbi:MAG TPA: hypothetical protein PK040_00435 [Anaerolineaceae bacterium]|nr:hypothetical protein [Anaerolineaceae bacterium]
MTRMMQTSEQRREGIEDALSDLGIARVLIDAQVNLRVEQAIRRDKQLSGLLSPVLEEIQRIDHALAMGLVVIGEIWKEGNENGWS